MRGFALVLCALITTTAYADPSGDFGAQARTMYRVAACGGSDGLPARLNPKAIARHCKKMANLYAGFRKKWSSKAEPFIAELRPKDAPKTVVYPFGGGDLSSALVTFPDATEITTISLEHAGDPTRLAALSPKQLKKQLSSWRFFIGKLLYNSDSESVKLQQMERGPLPGQLSFHIMGAAVMGYEPVGLRFFRLEADGSISYYSDAEIAELEGSRAKRKKGNWTDTDWSVAYSNMELHLRKAGDPNAPVVTHRHFAANLDNTGFDGSPLEKHLEAKGKVSAMTKAASYLMWMNRFSAIRGYLATHLAWMASDTSGIPPRHAAAAGLEQETYGRFTGTMMPTNKTDQAAFVRLFKKQGSRKLKFRYGYRDHEDRPHLVITRPAP